MIDVERIQQNVDCRDLIEADLGPAHRGNQVYRVYKCPLHGEVRGYSLVVYDDHWQCFGKCNVGGDAIAWLRRYHQLSFHDACQRLSADDLSTLRAPAAQRPDRSARPRPLSQPPGEAWQRAADRVVHQAIHNLWDEVGHKALQYLVERRGLTKATIARHGLGFIPGHHREWQTIEGLTVPCGVTIPWSTRGSIIWGIKVRRAAGQQRYQQVGGGNIAGCLYLEYGIRPGRPIMICEGEFDALVVQQVAGDLVVPVALGSAAYKSINPRWYPHFISAPSILVRMDDDEAGQRAVEQLGRLSAAVQAIQVPDGKDVNEFCLLAGEDALRAWVRGQAGCD